MSLEGLNTDSSLMLLTNNNSDIKLSMELQFAYTFLEIIVAIVAVIGNGMVILVFRQEKRLRRRTNYYIVSLAVADLLVGLLGIPFAILASVGLPSNLHACLFTVSLLVVLCTISIFCLVAVSVDRYWAILHPMDYSKNVRTKTTLVIISLCWVAGVVVGFLPLFGWHTDASEHVSCFFVRVMDYNYLVFLYFATIITPSLVMAAFYAHIYRVVVKQLKQIVTINADGKSSKKRINKKSSINNNKDTSGNSSSGGTMLRVLGAAQKREVKATQNLSIIVLFFMICWIPLYTINCVKAFCPECHISATLTDFCIILSHLNSAVNPILYAYHLRDFRAALKSLIFKMFNLKETPPKENYYKPSIVSHTNRNYEKRCSNQNIKMYVDSPVWLRQQQQAVEIDRPYTSSDPLKIPSVAEALTSPHQLPTDLPVTQKREMWMISEVSSLSEKDACQNNLAIISRNDDLEYCSDEDEVFISTCTRNDQTFEFTDNQVESEIIFDETNPLRIDSCENEDVHSREDSMENNSNSQPFSINVGSDFNIHCLENDYKSADLKRFSRVDNVSDLFSNSSSLEKAIGRNSKRTSPLKFVSDFLLNQTSSSFSRRSRLRLNKESVPNCGSSDIFQYLDLHRHCMYCSRNEYNLTSTDNR